jgi:DNA-binding XRE family transcriptional regulator/mannose-6-phosphate isomerase-like protein (cupin superfamily)
VAQDTPAIAIGERLRAAREAQQIGLREFSRRIHVSASMVSQIERGNVMPSVATLYSIVTELGISLDDLFAERENGGSGAPAAGRPATQAGGPGPAGRSPVQRRDSRQTLVLDTGVRWERLTSEPDPDVDFLYSVYEVGSASTAPDALVRHGGREYGYVQSGRLGVTIGFETYELDAGDSVSFDSTTPHRLFAAGNTAAEVIWLVVGRHNDPRAES